MSSEIPTSADQNTGEILAAFDKNAGRYAQCERNAKRLIEDFLASENVRVHSVTSRLKGRTSFEQKLTRTPGKYQRIEQITDVIGLRIVTYFHDDVDKVADFIRQEFDIDWENSVDKRRSLDPNSFGYLSLHYVAMMPEKRVQLREYKELKGIKFEIQIRSLLQHTWAEIEHDTGYKARTGISPRIRRRFARLAGLLEVADEEFANIREELEKEESRVSAQIIESQEGIPLNEATLRLFIENDPTLRKVEAWIQANIPVVFSRGELHLDILIRHLQVAGLTTIAQVKEALEANETRVNGFAEVFVKAPPEGGSWRIPRGNSLLYLSYITLAETYNKGEVMEKLDEALTVANQGESVVSRRGISGGKAAAIFRAIADMAEF